MDNPAGKHNCSICRREFTESDLVFVDNKWVCAECKPKLMQMIREGVGLGDIIVARHGKYLVMGKNAKLPDRCIKCNSAEGVSRLKRALTWHSPLLYILVFVALLIYIIVAIICSKKAAVEVSLCERHRKKRLFAILTAWFVVLSAIVLFFAGLGMEKGWMVVLSGVLLLAGIVIFFAFGVAVSAKRIDDEYVWLSGVGKPFLDTLPEWIKPS